MDRWDEAIDALRGLGLKTIGEKTNAVEVTGQLVDLRARIVNLRATEGALQAIMAKATKISDILEVQGQLTDVRGQIEQLDSERVHLEDQAALGTLAVTYTVPIPAVTEVQQSWDPAREADRATAALVAVLQTIGAAGIWVAIVWLPILAAFGILFALAVGFGRRLGLGRGRFGAPPAPRAPDAPAA